MEPTHAPPTPPTPPAFVDLIRDLRRLVMSWAQSVPLEFRDQAHTLRALLDRAIHEVITSPPSDPAPAPAPAPAPKPWSHEARFTLNWGVQSFGGAPHIVIEFGRDRHDAPVFSLRRRVTDASDPTPDVIILYLELASVFRDLSDQARAFAADADPGRGVAP